MTSLSRRVALKALGVTSAVGGLAATTTNTDAAATTLAEGPWSQTHDRVWLGAEYWANPMEDWRVKDGAAECISAGGNRSIHHLTHQLANADAGFTMTTRITRVEKNQREGGAGFRIGVTSDIEDHRANCFARNGVIAGVVEGKLRLGRTSKSLPDNYDASDFGLTLKGAPAGEQYQLQLILTDSASGKTIAKAETQVPAANILGNVALVNNFDAALKRKQGARYRFHNWTLDGEAFSNEPSHRFGPILWTQYSLSDSRGDDGFVLKLSALTGPLGEDDNHNVELQIEKNGQWKSLGEAELDADAWTAIFRVPNWNEKVRTKYRVVYRMKQKNGDETDSSWGGEIRENPVDRPLRLGALTCQNDYGFPYEPVLKNLVALDPDMLYFSGDQLYENHGGFGIIRDPAGPAILNYLRKFYQHGWSFRDAIKDRPTVCIPDDHDVFQGNIWGEGGAKMGPGGTSSRGGYREPARMVNVVHKTCAGHHPEAFDPRPCKQGISVYYGDLVFGNVSFAILGDRQFKSGPERVETGSGRADHVIDPNIDPKRFDKPGLELLGERQEKFLEHWVEDWRGHAMKVLLSQTVFAGVATHHGRYDAYLHADLDSGGWPQTPRNRALKILRKGKPLHINGDQHLTSLLQYGVDEQRDSCWSFCTPAISAGYPRWWRPDEKKIPHQNRPQHGGDNTGEYRDGFGNRMYVYAVGNPEVASKSNRYERAHQKGSGFALVTIDTEKRTYLLESFRFLIDATDGDPDNYFPHWPVTIHQRENGGDNVLA